MQLLGGEFKSLEVLFLCFAFSYKSHRRSCSIRLRIHINNRHGFLQSGRQVYCRLDSQPLLISSQSFVSSFVLRACKLQVLINTNILNETKSYLNTIELLQQRQIQRRQYGFDLQACARHRGEAARALGLHSGVPKIRYCPGRQLNFLLSSRIEILAHAYNFFSVIRSAPLAFVL